jgi:ParB family chromosome partitioning protein
MIISINNIRVTERIRKEIVHIPELAENIRQNGLITPIAVMSLDNGEYQLLAGLRRLKAMTLLGKTDIQANIFPACDAETALRIEYSENEQREKFTYSEMMDYTRLIEEIEKAKARERMLSGSGKPEKKEGSDPGRYPRKGRVTDIIGEKIGMSGKQYERAKYIADHATPEQIKQLDSGEKKIKTVFREIKDSEKAAEAFAAETANIVSEVEYQKPPKKRQTPLTRLQAELEEMTAKRDEFVQKYSEAEHKRGMLEVQLSNTLLQWQCEREGKDLTIRELNAEVEGLRAELEAANKRIKRLEGTIT